MIYLHIGLAKCGSTTIQHFLGGNPDLLARYGYEFPREGRRKNAHHQIYHSLYADPPGPALAELLRKIETADSPNIVISAEGLAKATDSDVDTLQREVIQGREAKVILYLRDMRSWMPSTFNQDSKRFLTTLNFDEHLIMSAAKGRLQLSAKVAIWAARFGAENIRVRTLDPHDLTGGSLLSDFCDAIGLPDHALAEADPATMVRRNEATWWQVAEFVRALTIRMAPAITAATQEEIADWSAYRGMKLREARNSADPEASRVPTVTIKRLPEACVEELEERGLPPVQAQYLTQEQARQLHGLYCDELRAIEALMPNTRLTPPAEWTDFPERPFLPSVTTMPREYVEAMNQGIRKRLRTGRLAPPIRRIAEAGVCLDT